MLKNKTVPGAERERARAAKRAEEAVEREQEKIKRDEVIRKRLELSKSELEHAQGPTTLSKKNQKNWKNNVLGLLRQQHLQILCLCHQVLQAPKNKYHMKIPNTIQVKLLHKIRCLKS